MHNFKACKACVCVWCVRGVFSCPWAALFGLKLSFRVTAGTFAPPSNFFHSHFLSFQREGHPASFSSSLFFFPPLSNPPFLPVDLHHPLLLCFSSPCHSSVIYSVRLCLQTFVPSHCGQGQRRAFFLLAAVNVSTFFFLSCTLLFPPSISHALLKWQQETYSTKAL